MFQCLVLWKIEECVYTKTQSEGTEDDKRLNRGKELVKTGVWNQLKLTRCISVTGLHFASFCWKFSQNSLVSKHQRSSSISFLSKSQV